MDQYFGDLGNLKPAAGAVKKQKRVGRGRGSGHGDTACKGDKGQQSRSGYSKNPGFEGGQMPLKRRIPKRGFTPHNRTNFNGVNLVDFERIEATEITPDVLRAVGLVKGRGPVVILGSGDINRAVNIEVHRITKTAQEKIISAGGSVKLIPIDPVDLRVKRGPSIKGKMRQTKSKLNV